VIGSDREGCILNRDAALDLALSDVAEAGEQVFSVHASRAAELEAHAARNACLRLTVRVTTRWGEALHGLPGGHARILALIDDRRTGREIFARLSAERSTATPYSLALDPQEFKDCA
jgi:hypothetical protein